MLRLLPFLRLLPSRHRAAAMRCPSPSSPRTSRFQVAAAPPACAATALSAVGRAPTRALWGRPHRAAAALGQCASTRGTAVLWLGSVAALRCLDPPLRTRPAAARRHSAARPGQGADSAWPHGARGSPANTMVRFPAPYPSSAPPARLPPTPLPARPPPGCARRSWCQPPRAFGPVGLETAQGRPVAALGSQGSRRSQPNRCPFHRLAAVGGAGSRPRSVGEARLEPVAAVRPRNPQRSAAVAAGRRRYDLADQHLAAPPGPFRRAPPMVPGADSRSTPATQPPCHPSPCFTPRGRDSQRQFSVPHVSHPNGKRPLAQRRDAKTDAKGTKTQEEGRTTQGVDHGDLDG
jgi:hypothetical protein